MKSKDKKGICVKINDKNTIDKALKQFKRKIKDSGLMLELKNRESYMKPSDIKREQQKKSRSRMKSVMLKTSK